MHTPLKLHNRHPIIQLIGELLYLAIQYNHIFKLEILYNPKVLNIVPLISLQAIMLGKIPSYKFLTWVKFFQNKFYELLLLL